MNNLYILFDVDLETVIYGNKSFELICVRTDCVKLPFSIEVTQGVRSEWQECLSGCLGPIVEVQLPNVTGIRLVWKTTDLHMLDGLCSSWSGGGIHVEILGALMSEGSD